jgi:hypothetical protein
MDFMAKAGAAAHVGWRRPDGDTASARTQADQIPVKVDEPDNNAATAMISAQGSLLSERK